MVLDVFSLKDVPKEALYVGLAGVLPYLATSVSTVYLAWDIQHAAHTGEGFLVSGEVAEQLLHFLEPIQLGYGATVRLHQEFQQDEADSYRSFPSWVPFIGALSGLVLADIKAINAMRLVFLPLL